MRSHASSSARLACAAPPDAHTAGVSEIAAEGAPRRRSHDRRVLLAVAAGGAVGGYLRVGLSLLPGSGSAASWPWITLSVNVAGTFLLAFTISLLTGRRQSGSLWPAFVGAGFCGTLTTFSTLQLEVFRMLRAAHWTLASGYLAATLLGGVLAVVAGFGLGRALAG
jgi:CrcB protein